MKCETLQPDLSALADGELEPALAARVAAHVAACFDCRQRLESFRAAGRRLRAEDRAADPSAACILVLRGRARRRLFRVGLRIAVAAAVVVAAALSFGPVQAQREAKEIVDLDGSVRVAATEELATVEVAQIELAALFMCLRSLDRDEPAARELSRAATALAARAAAIESKLREISEELDKDGLFPPAPWAEDDRR